MSRHQAREAAMQLIYAWDLGGDSSLATLYETMDIAQLDDEDRSYIGKTVQGLVEHRQEVDGLIGNMTSGWRLDRLAKVELAVLRLAVYESRYRSDVPEGVAINEAVELAKRYGGEKSGAFVNGILGALSRAANAEESVCE